MEIRPLTKAERKYTYTPSMQIQGQTGCIGHLRGDFGGNGKGFFTSWEDHRERLKTEEFQAEIDEVINALRSDAYGLLKNRSAMSEYAAQYPESSFEGNFYREYGFRAETEKHAFLIRCNTSIGDYNFYCYCYVKEYLDRHIEKAQEGIRFIDSRYKELFRIADGEKVIITDADGKKSEYACSYIDEHHTEIGRNLFHICEFAELLERCNSTCEPVKAEPEAKQSEERGDEKEDTGALELKLHSGATEQVTLFVSTYANNKSLFVGMTTMEDGVPEPYCDVTVNLLETLPPYCAFVDTNNMPELEDFLVKNGLAEYTGLEQRSGYCTYPLYRFDTERMRELCGDGILDYEQQNSLRKEPEKREMRR